MPPLPMARPMRSSRWPAGPRETSLEGGRAYFRLPGFSSRLECQCHYPSSCQQQDVEVPATRSLRRYHCSVTDHLRLTVRCAARRHRIGLQRVQPLADQP